jgi:hypothetical protein
MVKISSEKSGEESDRKMAGRDLYMGLYEFVERIVFGRRGELLAVVLPMSLPASYCAFLASVPELADTNQSSAAFTASTVALRVVEMAVGEGVCFRGHEQGLGIYLNKDITPALAVLLAQLAECVETIRRIENTSPALEEGLGGGRAVSFSAMSQNGLPQLLM